MKKLNRDKKKSHIITIMSLNYDSQYVHIFTSSIYIGRNYILSNSHSVIRTFFNYYSMLTTQMVSEKAYLTKLLILTESGCMFFNLDEIVNIILGSRKCDYRARSKSNSDQKKRESSLFTEPKRTKNH